MNSHTIRPLPSVEELNNHFIYDAETGDFFRKDNGFKYKRNRYYKLAFNGTTYPAHRIAWKMITGADPVNVIDHIDDDPTNTKFDNLQDITNRENVIKGQVNKYAVYPPHYCGSKTIHWVARPTINGKKYYLYGYTTEQDAIDAVKQLRLDVTGMTW